jgi:hypothetical protein
MNIQNDDITPATILSQTNSTHLTADMILFRTKETVHNSWFSFSFP